MSSAAYGARQLRKYLAPFLGGSSSDRLRSTLPLTPPRGASIRLDYSQKHKKGTGAMVVMFFACPHRTAILRTLNRDSFDLSYSSDQLVKQLGKEKKNSS
uniref:Uncharacterized protein n=1 Tax=Cucumis sativus TaxID=3659 RepID=A0A0A0KA93_CUCSA